MVTEILIPVKSAMANNLGKNTTADRYLIV